MIASGNYSTLKAGTVTNLLLLAIDSLDIHGIDTIATVADAAGENTNTFETVADSLASDWISKEVQLVYPGINFEQEIVFTDASGTFPRVCLSDMPHLVKNMRGAVQRSNLEHKSNVLTTYILVTPSNLLSSHPRKFLHNVVKELFLLHARF